MLDLLIEWLARSRQRVTEARLKIRWRRLQAQGMHIGQGVNLPSCTFIDTSACELISIGDWCGFGPQCVILAHDAQMDEFLDAGLMGRVTIHESCHFGARTVILPGVEVGPRTIVGANSVVSRSLPPETVCAGVPAKVICTLDEYLDRHRRDLERGRGFPFVEYNKAALTPERMREMREALENGPVYITGGFSEEMKGAGGTMRTPFDSTCHPPALEFLKRR